MPEVSLSEAAARLGVSVDTVRRRLRAGQLAGRQSGRQLLVTLPATAGAEAQREPAALLLAEVRSERDRLAAIVDSLLKQLAAERREGERLLALLERSLGRL